MSSVLAYAAGRLAQFAELFLKNAIGTITQPCKDRVGLPHAMGRKRDVAPKPAVAR